MGILDRFRAKQVDDTVNSKIERAIHELREENRELKKFVTAYDEPVFGRAVAGRTNPADIFYGNRAISNIGNNKAVMTEWWLNPLYGQPRLVDLRTVIQLARHGVGSMCVEKILDIIAQQSWTIRPKRGGDKPKTKKQFDGDQNKGNPAHIDFVREFLNKPNKNNETFDTLIRKVLRGILETDDGTIVKTFSEYEELDFPRNIMVGGNEVRVTQKMPKDNAELIEITAEDGKSFLKATDIHGYIMNYWQYSFILPRVPTSFWPREVCYISQNPRAGSPYGYSPFESIVDWLLYIIKAGKYNERFYENSAYPSFQLDLANVKTKDEMDQWAEWFRKNYMGAEKAWQVLLTNQGSKVIPLTFDNVALQNLETQTWYFYLICAKLKVPHAMLGIPTPGMARASAGQQTASFRSVAIKPLTKLIERSINNEILPELDPDNCCEFVFVEASDLDEEERRTTINAANIQNSIITPNEARLSLDLEPMDGLDTVMRQFQSEQTEKKAQLQPFSGALDAQQQQNAQARTAQKRPASELASYSGNKPKSLKREYIGMCAECVESVYNDTIDIHKDHKIMSEGKLYANIQKSR